MFSTKLNICKLNVKSNNIVNRVHNINNNWCVNKKYSNASPVLATISSSSNDTTRGCLSSTREITPYKKWMKNKLPIRYIRTVAVASTLYRNYSTENAEKVPEKADVFGDLGDRKYQRVALDKDENELEKFEQNEGTVPRRFKPSAGQYADMIKSHITEGNLEAALDVLNLIKRNRDKPNDYMYNLLIRGFAKQGDVKQAFKLYNDMKKRALEPKAPTYCSLIEACALSPDTKIALEKLNKLRQYLIEREFPMNETHYNVMIKAYGRHNCVLEAFQLADEMRDKHLAVEDITYNSLLHAALSDKDAGLRYALSTWHMMIGHRKKPTIYTYNLFLRAVRDCKLGKLTENDDLLPGSNNGKICFCETEKPDLLESPPRLSKLLLTVTKKLAQPKLEAKTSRTDDDDESEIVKYESSSPKDLAVQPLEDEPTKTNLDDILSYNRLILFGGIEGFLERMEKDNVVPDVKTITLLMELAPGTEAIERNIVNYAKKKKIQLDIDFYNMLIKKRSFRKDYKHAREVLHDVERSGLLPNIMTWGVLALGCRNIFQARELLEGMRSTGFTQNYVIIGAMLKNACFSYQFTFVNEMMNLMYETGIIPSQQIYDILQEFKAKAREAAYSKDKSHPVNTPRGKENYRKFRLRYSQFLEQMERKHAQKQKHKANMKKSVSI